jgi:hypothetical protein
MTFELVIDLVQQITLRQHHNFKQRIHTATTMCMQGFDSGPLGVAIKIMLAPCNFIQ